MFSHYTTTHIVIQALLAASIAVIMIAADSANNLGWAFDLCLQIAGGHTDTNVQFCSR